ncbi:MAG: hypothetical protein IPN86_00685 [Saprospiraceae bacterium]|nr:hypothetical protein [Saprospiraceae bacterium]
MKTPIFTLLFTLITFHLFSQEVLLLKSSGKVVIGDTSQITTPGNYNLYVQNGILTERVKVSLKTTSEWSDDAFLNTPELSHIAKSIENNKHLVDMPSATDLVKDGYELKNMDAKLLQQIEWLWQHLIKLDEENKLLKADILALKQVHIPNKK